LHALHGQAASCTPFFSIGISEGAPDLAALQQVADLWGTEHHFHVCFAPTPTPYHSVAFLLPASSRCSAASAPDLRCSKHCCESCWYRLVDCRALVGALSLRLKSRSGCSPSQRKPARVLTCYRQLPLCCSIPSASSGPLQIVHINTVLRLWS
jgi:hypothetical protein